MQEAKPEEKPAEQQPPKAEEKPDNDDEEEEEEEDGTKEEDEEEEKSETGHYDWHVTKFSKKKDRMLSDVFTIGGYEWQILLYPRGNSAHPQQVECLAVYLAVAEAKSLNPGWHRTADFAISVVNTKDPTKNVVKDAKHTFRASEADWGFNNFATLGDLKEPGFLIDDTLHIHVDVKVIKDIYAGQGWATWANWDSKKETGYVGLKNQGATCYMNSLLQALFHIGTFRKSVYQMPTQNDSPTASIPLALQRVFYRLQFGERSVGTKELTASFGWNRRDSFVQHDVQELNRVFCDNLEEKMKGTISEGIVEKLFRGKIYNYIKCINVNYESSRMETFYDISLNVKGMKNVYDSFEQYVAVETLSGENKYDAGQHGHQDANKGCFFQSLPPVLELHLKRFVYDFQRDRNFKINDRYEFPNTINLRRFLSSDADVSIKPLYRLYAVLVHSGDVHGGHYYAYVRPTTKMQWFKFDDERVTKARKKDVFEENYGGEVQRTYRNALGKPIVTTYSKSANAYMLLYIRDSEREQILHPVERTDIPPHLEERFEQEEAEKAAKKKEQAEAHLYIRLKVALVSDLQNWTGVDLCDFDQVKTFKAKKASTLKEFKAMAEEAFKIPVARQRYWSCPNRRNRTVRPDEPFGARDEETTLEKLAKRSAVDLKIFLEVSAAPPDVTDEKALFPPHTAEDAIMFFKFYDPQAESLRFLTYLFVKVNSKISSVAAELNKIIGQPEDAELLFFEEVKPTMVDPLDPLSTFTAAELGNGDVICVQKPLPAEHNFRRPLAPAYYVYMLNRVNVRFRELEHPNVDVHVLELAKDMSYDDVVAQLAQCLNTDPQKLRLTQHGCMYNKPRMQPLRSTVKQTLTDMLANPYSQKKALTDILYYEKLTLPIQELENNKLLKIDWYNQKVVLEKSHNILVGKNSIFADVIAKLKEVVELKGTQEIRLLEVHNSKIYRLLKPEERTTGYTEYTSLRAEEVPEEESKKEKGAKRIQVVHIWRDPPMTYTFGNPFYLLVPKGEKFGETKKRIQRKLELSDEEFASWKFAIVQWIGKPVAVEDDEVQIATKMDGMDCLGLEHKMPRRANLNRRKEEQLVIKG